jgi:transcriptional regulator with XRE-family HTH domain
MVGAGERRAELAVFLRTQRARLHPSDVGLPPDPVPGRRRTPGLRREEVAQLSGVGVTWYTWLEQGRNITTSGQVVDALARALRLDADQRGHLRSLAGLAPDVNHAPAATAEPRLQRLVDAVMPNPASLYDANLDYLAWNVAYARCRHDPSLMAAGRRNLLWMMFTDRRNRTRMARWEPAARAILGQFRAASGSHPEPERRAALVRELSDASPEFRRWWDEYPVRNFRPATIAVDHPEIGRLHLELFQLRPVERPDLLMVVEVPSSAVGLARVRSLLPA